MERYNIYYNNRKINKLPLSNQDILIVKSKRYISKQIGEKQYEHIPVKDIQIIKTTVF